MSKDIEAQHPTKLRAFAGNTYEDYYAAPMQDFPHPGKIFLAILIAILWLGTKILWPWKVEELKRLTEDKRGRVIIMNHESALDPIIAAVTMLMNGIHVRTIYRAEFDRFFILKWAFSRAGGFPVARGTADMKVIRHAKAALKRGECILIYPEGTRVKHDEDEQVHGGYALMAQLAHAPVQPMAIAGARHLHLFKRVHVRVGEPLSWNELTSTKRKDQLNEMEERGMAEVFALRESLRRDYPGIE